MARKTETAVAGLIEIEGLGAGHPHMLGHGIVDMIEGAIRHWLRSDSDAGREALAHQLADLARGSLCGRPA